MAVDLMQAVRASAFTVLVTIAKDGNQPVEVRLQAAIAVLSYTQDSDQNWGYDAPDADEELADEEAEAGKSLAELDEQP